MSNNNRNFLNLNPEGRVYDPERQNLLIGIGLFSIIPLVIGVIAMVSEAFGLAVFCLIVLVVIGIVCAIIQSEQDTAIAEAKKLNAETSIQKAEELKKDNQIIREDLRNMQSAIEDIRAGAITTGDIIVSGDGNSLVVGSGAITVARDIKNTNPEVGAAISEILGYIENSRNEAAAEYFEKMLEQLDNDKPDKTILRSLWDATLTAAPAIKNLTEAVSKIAGLVASVGE